SRDWSSDVCSSDLGPGAPRKMMSGSALGFCAGISKLIPIMPRGSTAASTFFSRSTVSARQQLACFCRVIQALVDGLLRGILGFGTGPFGGQHLGKAEAGC